MATYRLVLNTREQHQVIIDTADYEGLGSEPTRDELFDYFENIDEWILEDLIQGDATWFNTIETEFNDIYPVEES